MVIEIKIKVMGDKVVDSFNAKHTDLLENSIAIRRLEEIKLKLLKREYKSDFEMEEEDG